MWQLVFVTAYLNCRFELRILNPTGMISFFFFFLHECESACIAVKKIQWFSHFTWPITLVEPNGRFIDAISTTLQIWQCVTFGHSIWIIQCGKATTTTFSHIAAWKTKWVIILTHIHIINVIFYWRFQNNVSVCVLRVT